MILTYTKLTSIDVDWNNISSGFIQNVDIGPIIIKFYSNGNVVIPGEFIEGCNHFRMINNGNIECNEIIEVTDNTYGQRIYSDFKLQITGEFIEI